MLALRSGCNLISGLWCRLDQPAGPDGIRRGMPHLLHVLEGLGSVQVYFPAVRPALPSSAHLPAQPFSEPTLFFWFVDLPRGGQDRAIARTGFPCGRSWAFPPTSQSTPDHPSSASASGGSGSVLGGLPGPSSAPWPKCSGCFHRKTPCHGCSAMDTAFSAPST